LGGREQAPTTLGRPIGSGHLGGLRIHLWRAFRLGALWGNLLYAVCVVAAMGVLVGLGPAPWRAYANVLLALIIGAGTALLNVKAARGADLPRAVSALAVVLNVVCLGYLVTKPDYSISVLKWLVALVPVLNVIVVSAGWGARRVPWNHMGPDATSKSA
jgi:hypothetical protein